jgi:hypothetical protein
VSDITLLLLQIREEMVRLVERARVPPVNETGPEPNAFVLAVTSRPALRLVDPE